MRKPFWTYLACCNRTARRWTSVALRDGSEVRTREDGEPSQYAHLTDDIARDLLEAPAMIIPDRCLWHRESAVGRKGQANPIVLEVNWRSQLPARHFAGGPRIAAAHSSPGTKPESPAT
jgi:hypothetical protein